jgi:hypothetical protein
MKREGTNALLGVPRHDPVHALGCHQLPSGSSTLFERHQAPPSSVESVDCPPFKVPHERLGGTRMAHTPSLDLV